MNSDGLTTTVQPAASAGAHFQATNSSGEFHGVMPPTTPIGSCRVKAKVSGLSIGTTRALDLVRQPAEIAPPSG